MSFWENVEYEREYQNLTRKELAYKASFSVNSIPVGIERKSVPSAEIAYRIAKVLGVSIEYLLGEEDIAVQNNLKERDRKYLKYAKFIDAFDKLSPEIQKDIEKLVQDFSEK